MPESVAEIKNFRKKYPQYDNIDDSTLAVKLAAKYPEYKFLVEKVNSQLASSRTTPKIQQNNPNVLGDENYRGAKANQPDILAQVQSIIKPGEVQLMPEQTITAKPSNIPLRDIPLTDAQRQIGMKIPLPNKEDVYAEERARIGNALEMITKGKMFEPVYNPIVEGAEQIYKGGKQIVNNAGDILPDLAQLISTEQYPELKSKGETIRGVGNIAGGGFKTILGSLPPVMALNAVQPVITKAAGDIGESLGVKRETAENLANKITPFVFGLPVGIGSLASEETVSLLDQAGAFKSLSEEDQLLAKDLIQNGLFLGIAAKGGKLIKRGKEFRDLIKDNRERSLPFPKGKTPDQTLRSRLNQDQLNQGLTEATPTEKPIDVSKLPTKEKVPTPYEQARERARQRLAEIPEEQKSIFTPEETQKIITSKPEATSRNLARALGKAPSEDIIAEIDKIRGSVQKTVEVPKTEQTVDNNRNAAFSLFKDDKSVNDVSKALNISRATVIKYKGEFDKSVKQQKPFKRQYFTPPVEKVEALKSETPIVESIPNKGTYWAIRLNDGKMIYGEKNKYSNHADLVEKKNINPNDLESAGFIVNGKYNTQSREIDRVERIGLITKKVQSVDEMIKQPTATKEPTNLQKAPEAQNTFFDYTNFKLNDYDEVLHQESNIKTMIAQARIKGDIGLANQLDNDLQYLGQLRNKIGIRNNKFPDRLTPPKKTQPQPELPTLKEGEPRGKEPYQTTRDEFVKHTMSKFLSHKYKPELVEQKDLSKFPIKIKSINTTKGDIDFRQTGEKLSYTNWDDVKKEVIRDEKGNATYLTDEQIKNQKLPTNDETIWAFDGDKKIGLVSNEWGVPGVWVAPEYQKLGIGKELLKEYIKRKPETLEEGGFGQVTKEGLALNKSLHKDYVDQALKEGKPVPENVLAEYPDLAEKYKKSVVTESTVSKQPEEKIVTTKPIETEKPITDIEGVKKEKGTGINLPEEKSQTPEGREPKRIISQESYDTARKNILEKSGNLNAGIDPTLIKDFAFVGAYHLENIVRSGIDKAEHFAEYSKKMIEDFGEKVKPYLKDVWEQMKEDHPELREAFTAAKETKANENPEFKVRGLARSTEAKAIVSNITKSLEGLPEYEVLKNEPQIKVAADLITNDFNRAKRIVLGEEKPPETTLPGFIYKGLEDYAVKNNDVKLIKELGTSPYLAEQATTAGQFIQSLRNQDPLSPVNAIKEVIKAREESPKGKRDSILIKSYDNKIESLEKKIREKDEEIAKIQAEKAVKKIQRENEFQARREKRTYTKEQLHIERKDLFSQLYKVTAKNYTVGSAFGGLNTEAIKILGEITKNYVKEGITDVSQIVDSIHKEVKDTIEGITPRDIRNAISGYGRETRKTRSQLTTEMNDVKRQMALISKIEDLEAGKPLPKRMFEKSEPSKELLALKEKLKRELEELGIKKQESLAKSKERLQKSLQEINDKIQKGDYAVEEKTVSPVDAEKAKLQKELKELREQYKNIQKNLGEKLTDQEAQTIADLSKKATEAKTKMEDSPRREPLKPATEEELEYGRAKVAFAEYIDELKASANKLTFEEFKKDKLGTLGRGVKHIPGITKSAKATLDDSGLFNQGVKVLYTHPTVWARNALKSFQDISNVFGGKNVLAEISADIVSRPNYDLYKKDHLAVGVIEEAFPDSKLLEKIPYLGRVHKAADVAFTGFAYRNRADLYDLYTEIAKKNGIEETTGQGIGKLVNSLTGRGDLGKLERAGDITNVVLFAPRYVKSHWDVLTAHTFGKEVSPFMRKQAAINLLKIIGSSAAVMASASAVMPGSVETDPRSSDFGSIKVGNTRFHFMGGMNSLLTLASRILPTMNEGKWGFHSKSTTTKEVTPLNSHKFGAKTGWDVLLNFGEGKLAPVAGLTRDILKDQTFGGDRLTVGNALQNLVVPLPITNYEELMKDPKSANVIIATIADALGIFTNTYSNDKNVQKIKSVLLRADEEKLSFESKENFYQALYDAEKAESVTKDQAKTYRENFDQLQKEAEPRKRPKDNDDPAWAIKAQIKDLKGEIKQKEDAGEDYKDLESELDKKETALDKMIESAPYQSYLSEKEKKKEQTKNDTFKRVQEASKR